MKFFNKMGKHDHDYGSDPQSTVDEKINNSPGLEEKLNRHIHKKQRNYIEKSRKEKRHKVLASVIIDQLGDAIEQVAMKDSKLNKGGEIGGLYSARKLAKQLFNNLNILHPGRKFLLVEGE